MDKFKGSEPEETSEVQGTHSMLDMLGKKGVLTQQKTGEQRTMSQMIRDATKDPTVEEVQEVQEVQEVVKSQPEKSKEQYYKAPAGSSPSPIFQPPELDYDPERYMTRDQLEEKRRQELIALGKSEASKYATSESVEDTKPTKSKIFGPKLSDLLIGKKR